MARDRHASLVTPEQAAEMWCPNSRVVPNHEHYAAGNRFEKITSDTASRLNAKTFCIGPHCMAWRWRTVWVPAHSGQGPQRVETPKRGYCGAFGKPENTP